MTLQGESFVGHLSELADVAPTVVAASIWPSCASPVWSKGAEKEPTCTTFRPTNTCAACLGRPCSRQPHRRRDPPPNSC